MNGGDEEDPLNVLIPTARYNRSLVERVTDVVW